MKTRTALKLIRGGQLPLLVGLTSLVKPVYRTYFLSAASSHGLLALLRSGPQRLDAIARSMSIGAEDLETLRAWLDLGVRLGDLKRQDGAYRLGSWLATRLAAPGSDTAVAAMEEVVRFHHQAVALAPQLMKERRRLTLADQDGALIARSTRVLQPFVEEAIEMVVPRRGGLRLLEVGCGEAEYIRYAAKLNVELTGIGVDLQQDVVAVAQRNLREWGLGDRFRVLHGDVRSVELPADFDVVTLFNLIYYFPLHERVDALARLRGLLRPGGKLVLTTGTDQGNLGVQVVSLWFSASNAGGRMPAPDEMVAQMTAAGFKDVAATRIVPGDGYFAFTGTN